MRMLSQIIYIISRNWCSCNYSSGNYSICINNLIIWCGILIVDLRKVFAWFITSSIVGTNIYTMETIEHQGIRVNWTVFNVALSSPAGTSGIVMTSILSPTSAFSCWNAIWLEPNSWFRIGFLSCDEYMTRMTRKSTSGIVREQSFFCKYSILSSGYFPLSVVLFVCRKEATICRKEIATQ